MHRTGENVPWMPVVAISVADARAIRWTREGSQVQAMPSWVGKMVAPGQNEWPWMQSSAVSSGIPSRVRWASSTASGIRAGVTCRTDPASLADTMSSRSPCWASSISNCPAFSSKVIRDSKSSILVSTDASGSRYTAERTGCPTVVSKS